MFEHQRFFDRSFREPVGWDDLFRGFDQLFRELEREPSLSSFGHASARLIEEDERYVLAVEVPGVTEKDVKVDLQDGVLTVAAERAPEVPAGYAARRRERTGLRFSRSFLLGERVDPEKTTAELKDGVLTIGIAKARAPERRAIPVQTG